MGSHWKHSWDSEWPTCGDYTGDDHAAQVVTPQYLDSTEGNVHLADAANHARANDTGDCESHAGLLLPLKERGPIDKVPELGGDIDLTSQGMLLVLEHDVRLETEVLVVIPEMEDAELLDHVDLSLIHI